MKQPRKQKLIRVTSVLSFVESAWKEFWWRKVGFEVADKISKDSAEFGTKVHELIGDMLIHSTRNVSNDPIEVSADRAVEYINLNNIKPYFETWKDSLEVEVKDEKLGLIGHFDCLALVDNKPTIIDFKTSNKMRKSFPLQKAAYAKMANTMFSCNITNGLIIRSHWDKETGQVDFEVKHYPNLIKKYWPKFKAALVVWKYFNRVEK